MKNLSFLTLVLTCLVVSVAQAEHDDSNQNQGRPVTPEREIWNIGTIGPVVHPPYGETKKDCVAKLVKYVVGGTSYSNLDFTVTSQRPAISIGTPHASIYYFKAVGPDGKQYKGWAFAHVLAKPALHMNGYECQFE